MKKGRSITWGMDRGAGRNFQGGGGGGRFKWDFPKRYF